MCIIQTHRYESATVKSRPVGQSGVIQVDYFGMFTEASIEALTGKVLEEGARGRVMLVRLDRAIMAFNSIPPAARQRFMGHKIPGAVVCSPEQRDAVRAICSELSAVGALRVVFVDYQDALQWAERLAAGFLKEELRLRPSKTPLHEDQDRLLVGCRITPPANAPEVLGRRHR